MAVTVVDAKSAADSVQNTPSTPVNVSIVFDDAPSEDDVIVAFVHGEGTANHSITSPSDFSTANSMVSLTDRVIRVETKVCGAAEADTFQWTFQSSSSSLSTDVNGWVSAIVLRGLDVDDLVEAAGATGTASASDTIVAPEVTPAEDDCFLVAFFSCNTLRTYTPPSGMDEQVDFNSLEETQASLAIATETLTASGATGTRTAVTDSSAANQWGSLVAFNTTEGGGDPGSGGSGGRRMLMGVG